MESPKTINNIASEISVKNIPKGLTTNEIIQQVKAQCADELEEITKLYVLKDKDLDSLIKKWREK